MRAAKRVGPRQAASRDGFVTAVRPFRTVTASTELTAKETCTSRRSPGAGVRARVVGHERQASTLAPRGDRDCVTSSDFRAAMQAR